MRIDAAAAACRFDTDDRACAPNDGTASAEARTIGNTVRFDVRSTNSHIAFNEENGIAFMTPLFISDAGFGTIIVMAYYVSNYNGIRNIPHPIYWI
ncbi:hypothetical protein BURPS668_A0705 [Burkholderia pseudomallei 668]|nr:hypothetical protein BURPS668_A0705 [Burkholderia pseudomallei 668]